MTTIYYKPHRSRKREAQFFRTLSSQFPEATIRQEGFSINRDRLQELVDTHALVTWLETERLLPDAKCKQCIHVLKGCPAQIKIALKASQISFDIVVVRDQQAYYWEFHEEQHRRLTVSRTKKVFATDGRAIEVPRYVQRLVRDVWRTLHFRPYTIVWSDWFEENQLSYKATLGEGVQEFHKEGKFSFRRFCRI